MEYKERPDYGRCVAIVASASLREMIKPGALAIILPILVETGAPGGKVIYTHKVAVTGDTVEDPYKGTMRHSLYALIRILAMITLIMAAVFLREFVNIYCKDLPKYSIHFPRFPDILQNEESDRVIASKNKNKKDRLVGGDTSKRIDVINNRLAIVDMKLDTKPGHGETLVLGVALNAIGCVRPHVLKGLGQIWSAVRTATDPSSASTGSGS
ncbi:hypothetical protein ACOSP7_021369 [Xanthoceras sorbifolium]